MTNKHALLIVLLAACGSADDDGAESDGDLVTAPASDVGRDIDARIAAATAVVHGSVVDLAYRVTPDGPLAGIPRTRVTLRVATALKGAAVGDSVALEFLGGLDPKGGVTLASETPVFGVGDELAWLVGDSLANGCPLVGCSDGVIRISGGAAYDVDGHGLFLDGDVLRRGPREDIREATEMHIGNHTFHRTGEATGDIERVVALPAITRSQLLGWLTSHTH